MRNEGPFGVDLLVYLCAFIIQSHQIMIDLVQGLGGQGRTGGMQLMSLAFEFRKESLTEQRCTEALQKMIEDISPALLVRFGFQQIHGHQYFVDRRGYLCHHDAIAVIDELLRPAGEEGMHGMPQFMGYGEGIIQRIGVVQQHIGMHAIYPTGEGAAPLALIFVHIHPVFCKGPVQQLLVLLSQGLGGVFDQFLHIFKRHRIVYVLYHGHIQVKDIQFIQLQCLLAQGQIFLHGRQAFVNGFDQTVIYGYGYVSSIQIGFDGRTIPPDIGKESIKLDLPAVQCGKSIAVLAVGTEHGPESLFPNGPAAAFPIYAEVPAGKLDFFPRFIMDLGEHHVHVGQHFISGRGGIGSLAQHGQHLFLIGRKRMGPAPGNILYHVAVYGHILLRHPCIQLFLWNGQNLRIQKAGGGVCLYGQAHAPGFHLLIGGL